MSTSSVIPGIPTTAVPQIQFTPQGVIVPSDLDILAGRQQDINNAFGGGLNPDLSTPQGQLASSDAAIISDKDAEILLVTNQVDPQFASGRFQDAIGRIYFMERDGAEPTVVSCVMTGPGGTVPAGSLARDTNGNTYTLLAPVTIPASGTAMSSWANILTGPIPCPAGTLTQVYQSVPGWDAISNPTDGALGQLVESRNAFEFRRQQSVAINGRGTTQSINALVFAVANVLDCYVIDNSAGVVVLKGSTNYPMQKNSVYVAVVGGDAQDICNAIWNKKNLGCNYNGNTTLQVLDTDYSLPQPSYPVSFEIPAPLSVFFQVSIVNNPALPSNLTQLIQAAIIAQFNGTNGSQRARIAALILATSYYGVIAQTSTLIQIVSVTVGAAAAPTGASLQLGIDQAPSISAENITVVFV